MARRGSWTGEALKRERKQRKLTQVKLAKKAGVDSITISRIERGEFEPSTALLSRLARVLGVPIVHLLGDGG